jgi:tRNA (mo5U34)-methyltransferase
MDRMNTHTPPSQSTPSTTVQQTVERLGPWFHNIHLPDGTQTAPDHPLGDFPAFKWQRIAPHIPEDLSGWSVLDVGCNAGFYSVQLAQRGAEVLAIDHDEFYLEQARWITGQFGLADRISFEKMEVYELASVDRHFDLIWFMGVLYHLRYPLLAIDILADRVRRMLVFQTLMMNGEDSIDVPDDLPMRERERMHERGFPKMAFIENKLAGDPTNWWIPNSAGAEAMLRSAGLRVRARPLEETFICEPAETRRATNRLLPAVRTEDPAVRRAADERIGARVSPDCWRDKR